MIAYIFVLIFIFNNEPTGQAYRFMDLFINDENRCTDRRDSGGHDKQQNMIGLNKKKDFSILIDSHFYEPISIIKYQSMQFSVDEWTVQNTDAPSIQ